MGTEPKKVAEADVVRLHRPSGELTFRAALENVKPQDVVEYQGVAYTVTEVGPPDDRHGTVEARAYVAQIEQLGDVEPWVLRLRPGDVVVLTTKTPLPAQVASDLAERAKAFLPGYQVMVLDSNVKIGRIRPEVGSGE